MMVVCVSDNGDGGDDYDYGGDYMVCVMVKVVVILMAVMMMMLMIILNIEMIDMLMIDDLKCKI